MTTTPAIRLLTHPHTKIPIIHLHCQIKPSAAKIREGITSITSELIHICVSARPVNGESNKAVRYFISRAMGVPKSDVEIVKGLKNKEKVVAVGGFSFSDWREKEGGEGRKDIRKVELVRKRLEETIARS